ncbi:uncharacterized protein LOC111620591 [Centruroides sculpturatus]|uniref:uncharacterized protein LOC111620591 n=1 Tax=Centruroides sculpturatus TaxID=218467 RepID=UPI000C6D7B00|nr:uncharacterized protein LOC111620591 [Centruroides sculpturatus]
MRRLAVIVVLIAVLWTRVRCHEIATFDIGKHYAAVARMINEASKGEMYGGSELHPRTVSGQGSIDYDEPGKGGWWQGWAKGWLAGQKYAAGRGFLPPRHG